MYDREYLLSTSQHQIWQMHIRNEKIHVHVVYCTTEMKHFQATETEF